MAHLKTQLDRVSIGIAHLGYLLTLIHCLTFPHQNGFIVRVGRYHAVSMFQNNQISVASHFFGIKHLAITGGNDRLTGLTGDINAFPCQIKGSDDLPSVGQINL